ncbi:hypothetical protein LXL04_003812 [Taraxacum kok-saghyz]
MVIKCLRHLWLPQFHKIWEHSNNFKPEDVSTLIQGSVMPLLKIPIVGSMLVEWYWMQDCVKTDGLDRIEKRGHYSHYDACQKVKATFENTMAMSTKEVQIKQVLEKLLKRERQKWKLDPIVDQLKKQIHNRIVLRAEL